MAGFVMSNQNKKSTAIRFDIENYKLIKESGITNNRTISGQANWMCKVIWQLQRSYPDIYTNIIQRLSSKE